VGGVTLLGNSGTPVLASQRKLPGTKIKAWEKWASFNAPKTQKCSLKIKIRIKKVYMADHIPQIPTI
jgi:hypothetical protein